MSLTIDQQIQKQFNEFLPKTLKFVKTEIINPIAKKNVNIENRVDIDHEDIEELMKWNEKYKNTFAKGYINNHMNCYMISILQVLTHTVPFFNYMTTQKIDINNIFFKALTTLFSNAFQSNGKTLLDDSSKGNDIQSIKGKLSKGKQSGLKSKKESELSTKYLSPIVFEKNLKKLSTTLRRYHQEDATEFYLVLLDHIHEAIVGKGVNKISAISSIFHSTLTSRLTCYNCLSQSDHDEHFSILPINITKEKSVESGLNDFFKSEEISQVTCEKCKMKGKASKQYVMKQLPWILSLQLKRFTWDEKKINGYIKFPLQLNMSKYGIDGIYNLYAIVVHLGRTKYAGHYVAYCKSPSGGWCVCDDESIRRCTIKDVQKQEAYMLFYQRSDEQNIVVKKQAKVEQIDNLGMLKQIIETEKPKSEMEIEKEKEIQIGKESENVKEKEIQNEQKLFRSKRFK